MINLASFFTIQIPGQIPGAPQIGTVQLTPATGLLQGDITTPNEGGSGIFDLLLSQIEQQIDQQLENSGDNAGENLQLLDPKKSELLQSNNPLLEKNPTLDLVKILADNDGIAEDIAGLDLIEEIEQTLALNQQVFDNIIEAGTENNNLQIDKETGEITVPDIAKALNIFNDAPPNPYKDISAFLAEQDLSTLNLTPQQITFLQEAQNSAAQIEEQAQEIQEIQEIVEAITAGFATIIAPPPKHVQKNTDQLNIFSNDNSADAQNIINALKQATNTQPSQNTQNNLSTQDTTDIAARLNTLIEASDEGVTERRTTPLSFNDGTDIDSDFEQILRLASVKQYAGNPAIDLASANKPAQQLASNTPSSIPAPAFVLESFSSTLIGSLFSSTSISDPVLEQLGLSLNSQQSIAQGSLIALVNHAQTASQPHPATQMVAATIQKTALNGDTDLSLQLDPPDLGRVDVRMTFGKDKTVKAVVTAEKPETYMMMQRDAQILERALQDAGLDADGGLSFELAEHGFDFNHNNQRGGGHDHGGTGSNAQNSGNIEIIETTMTWLVDPETGHTRYDIWA